MTIGFGLAAYSLVRFTMSSVWLLPLLVPLAVSVLGLLCAMISGNNKGRVSRQNHEALVSRWLATTPASEMPSVDIFLPSAGEDLPVLRNTFTYVSELRWAGTLRVWVMDDAAKPEVADLAAEYGFDYVVRPNRGVMKKAGNLRYSFENTSGDFIVILDADFCPRADFLEHTMPYMHDENIGIVQTPQFFDTPTRMGWLQRTAGATQELFYRWVQPSRDRAGAPICVGTCALYRRAALDAVGGFASIEHSEDVHTGLALMRGGFTTRYVPIVVSRGLCPVDLSSFLNQQYRWCNGSITTLKSDTGPKRPLTLWQRICFWSGVLYYISTAINVLAIHLPGLIMAVWFAADVRAEHYVPFLAAAWVYFVAMPLVSKSTWRFDVLRVQMAYSFSHAIAILHKLTGRSAEWVPTGGVAGTNSLARSIAGLGASTLITLLGASWIAFGIDVSIYGLREFWPMGIFLAAYSYLAIPLTWGFIRILFPPKSALSSSSNTQTVPTAQKVSA